MTIETLQSLIDDLKTFEECDEQLVRIDAGVSSISVDFTYDGVSDIEEYGARKAMIAALRQFYVEKRNAAAKRIADA